MKFSELVRLLERHGFTLVREKGSIRYYGKSGLDRLIRIDYGTCNAILKAAGLKERGVSRYMIDLQYSLVIEATADPNFYGFYSPDLEGFTGVGHSIEDCLYKAKWGMEEHVALLREQGLPVPTINPDLTVVIHNEQRAEAVA